MQGDTLILGDDASVERGLGIAPAAASVDDAVELPGRLVWDEDHTVRVFSPFAGRVLDLRVQPGDRVAAGTVLAVLSSADFGTAQSDAGKAEAAATLAHKALDRARDLKAHGIIATRDMEQAESDAAAADAEQQRARSRLKALGAAGADVDQRYRLTSPIAGVVVEKSVNPGQELTADQSGPPLFVITDPTKLWVQLDAHESELSALLPGKPLTLRSAEYPDEHFAGTLTQIADFVDPVTRAVRVRGRVDNADRRLKGEMYVTASLPAPSPASCAVPATAVFLIGDAHYVFVAAGKDEYRRQPVEIGVQVRGMVPIRKGLAAGDPVVGTGALYLQQLMQSAGG